LGKISILWQNFDFWAKFQFLGKISIFGQNFDFWAKFRFLAKILIFKSTYAMGGVSSCCRMGDGLSMCELLACDIVQWVTNWLG